MKSVVYVLMVDDLVVGVFDNSRDAEKVMLGEMSRLHRSLQCSGVMRNVYFTISAYFMNSTGGCFQHSTATCSRSGSIFVGFDGRGTVLEEMYKEMTG